MAIVISNKARVYVDGYDLTIGGLQTDLAAVRDPLDKTTIVDMSERHRASALGKLDVPYSGLFDTTDRANFAGIKALVGDDEDHPWALHYGEAVGKRATFALVKIAGLKTSGQNNTLIPLSAEVRGQGLPIFGKVLYPKTTVTSGTTVGAVLDGGAASTAGVTWVYNIIHITATGGNADWLLKIQHSSLSSLSSLFTDIASRIVSSTTARAAIVESTATAIKRYLRFKPTRDATTGSITVVVAVKRK